MWNPAVPGMEDAHICAVLSFRRIRRYPVLPFKTAEKHVTLVMWGSPYRFLAQKSAMIQRRRSVFLKSAVSNTSLLT